MTTVTINCSNWFRSLRVMKFHLEPFKACSDPGLIVVEEHSFFFHCYEIRSRIKKNNSVLYSMFYEFFHTLQIGLSIHEFFYCKVTFRVKDFFLTRARIVKCTKCLCVCVCVLWKVLPKSLQIFPCFQLIENEKTKSASKI